MYLTTTPHINGLGFILAVFFITGGLVPLWSQQPQERVYADDQDFGGTSVLGIPLYTMNNEDAAADDDKDTYSTISITALGEVWQKLDFTTTQQPGPDDPVHVKIGTSTGLVSLATGLEFQAYNGNTPVGGEITLGSLMGLLNGADQADIVLPVPGVPYNSVRVRYNGIALGGGVNIYGAYFNEPGDNIACNTASDILWGSEAGLSGGVNAVDDPQNAIDGDNLSFAELHATVSVLGKTHITALYPTTSIAGDSVRIVFQNPGGLLDLGLLSESLQIKAYMDNDEEETEPLDLDANVLSLRLLPGEDDIQVITYPVDIPFNRIQVSIGDGLATALGALRVYEVQTIPKAPDIQDDEIYICYGDDVTLSVADPVTGSEYRWYDNAGVSLGTGVSHDITNLEETTTYYLAESREGCTDESARASVTVHVQPDFGNPAISILNEND